MVAVDKFVAHLFAVGSFASMLGGLFWGKLSDRPNRRKVFPIAGFLGTALSTFLFALAKSVPSVILANAIYTFFIAATVPIPVLIITKAFRLEDWDYEIGRFNEIGGWAWVLGLVVGFVLSHLPLPKPLPLPHLGMGITICAYAQKC